MITTYRVELIVWLTIPESKQLSLSLNQTQHNRVSTTTCFSKVKCLLLSSEKYYVLSTSLENAYKYANAFESYRLLLKYVYKQSYFNMQV